MATQSSEDFLLKNFVFDIKKQSYILIFETKCKIFRSLDISSMPKYFGTSTPWEKVIDEIERHLDQKDLHVNMPETLNDPLKIVDKWARDKEG